MVVKPALDAEPAAIAPLAAAAQPASRLRRPTQCECVRASVLVGRAVQCRGSSYRRRDN